MGFLGFIGLFWGLGNIKKSVLESLHISEKNHFLGLFYLAFLVLTNFKVILGFLGLCRANWDWGKDHKTVLGSTHKYIVSFWAILGSD